MLTVVTWKWGAKYGADHVVRLAAGVARHLDRPHRFVCITDRPEDLPRAIQAWHLPDPYLTRVDDGCYARLRMFDPLWQVGTSRFLCLDLDLVVTGDLGPLVERDEPFVILHGGHFNPCPFNGSVMLIAAGAHPELWTRFDLAEAHRIAHADGTNRGSDQTWIAAKAPDAAGWTFRDGIYAFGKPGWPNGDDLPADARIVTFPGKRDPSQMTHLPWIRKHWLGE